MDEYIVKDGRVILSETAGILPALDLSLQFQIYNCSARYMRPSLTDLATPFASQGEVAGDFLIENLSAPSDDAVVLSTLELLVAMKLSDTFDVTTDSESMMLLGARVDQMRSDGMRAQARSRLQSLYRARGG